ncbi:MSMEG_1061 family FMN-dependent PPOX-type flavoprotein [Ilumatobacter sp.]|uniref:MSMEG_1061 family FMN-dependent PPOX-type flavoprotein n=1 Tax=Ilumatobacter sp. TaxID=1967498 RepID=UPI003AF86D0C
MEIPGRIETLDQLTALYRPPSERALGKQLDHIDGGMAAFIDLSPFLVLSTTDGADSVDASPRGGPPGFVRRLDDRHIAIPDLNGNNRLDSHRNIVAHGRAGVLMIVPGRDETLRLNGPAAITTDPDILAGFTEELRRPKAAIVVETAEIYGHCAKAFRRAQLWVPSSWEELAAAPDLAAMYSCMWQIDEPEMRDALEHTYEADLARD